MRCLGPAGAARRTFALVDGQDVVVELENSEKGDGDVLGGQKFYGKGLDTSDARKKKYVRVWFDSMSTTPMTLEGTFDKEKKRLTMIGEGPGMDGKPAKWRSVSEMPDKDTVHFRMYVGSAKDPMFTIMYKRKK